MAASQDYINALLDNPREILAVEIKDWIDPTPSTARLRLSRLVSL